MEKMIKVLAWENKENEGRYLAAGVENGDLADENRDNGIERIEYCFLATNENEEDDFLESLVGYFKQKFEEHERFMISKFGPDAYVSLTYSDLIKYYKPKVISIPYKKFIFAMNVGRWR